MTNQPPTDALRLVPVEPTEAMLDAVKPWPEHWPPYGQATVTARAAYDIDRAVLRSNWTHMLAAAPASPLPGGVWRTDFENAPDCEEGILIVDATKISPAVGTARFIDGEWCGYDHGHGVECLWPSPTHWMPLPSPPSEVQK